MSQREGVDIIVNGGVWNSVPQSGIVSAVCELSMDKMKFMSKEAMIQWMLDACDLAEETLAWKKNATLSKKIKYIRDYFKEHNPDRVTTMSILTNIVLSGQGLGTLSGFGYSVNGGKPRMNSELIASRDIKET